MNPKRKHLCPSEETKEAMQEHITSNLKTYNTYDEMMKDIDKNSFNAETFCSGSPIPPLN